MHLIGCLKADYQTYSTIGNAHLVGDNKLEYPNCTMPWQQSMLGHHWTQRYNQAHVIACNKTDAITMAMLDIKFFKIGARTENPKCLGMTLTSSNN
jgi:hypothetical protein